MKKQKLTLNEELSQIKKMMGKLINEQPFNKDKEPLMTHQQYMDYSEPSEPDFNEMGEDGLTNVNPVNWLSKELEKNDIFLENYGSYDEYSLSGEGNYDFLIYFDSPNDFESPVLINIYNGDTKETFEKKFNDVIEALNFILSVRDIYNFESYESAVKSYEKSQMDDMKDRYNNRMERGNFG